MMCCGVMRRPAGKSPSAPSCWTRTFSSRKSSPRSSRTRATNMAQRIEWRTMGSQQDAVITVDEENSTVSSAQEATPAVLRLFLNDIVDVEKLQSGKALTENEKDPDSWGELIIARKAQTGEILDMDPELFCDGIYVWFRSRGVDPNL